jgi:glycosyltransferase involved in cell wall biosynthesis
MTDKTRLDLGFACSWWSPREPTWSYTASRLLRALQTLDDPHLHIQEIDAQRATPTKVALDVVQRVSRGDPWQAGALNAWLTDRRIRRQARSFGSTAVLGLGYTEPQLDVPTFFYQDLGYNHRLDCGDHRFDSRTPRRSPLRRLPALAERERERYDSAAGVFTMGRWYADWLVEHLGVQADKVHAVGGGITSLPSRRPPPEPGRPRRRLLFIGRHFLRKGGDLVIEAAAQLRQAGAGDFTLTVVGPPTWPLAGPIPPWVDFRGTLRPAEVAALLPRHDMLVLPSWFEAYGLAFLEARASGLPCVARRAFAMPELVPEGRAGLLVPEDGGSDDIAEAIAAVSGSEYIYAAVAADADAVVRDNSWSAVARRITDGVDKTLAGLPTANSGIRASARRP